MSSFLLSLREHEIEKSNKQDQVYRHIRYRMMQFLTETNLL